MRKALKLFCTCSVFAIIAVVTNTTYSAVTSRPTAANNAASARAQNRTSARMSGTLATSLDTEEEIFEEPEFTETIEEEETVFEAPIIVDNKTSMFNDVLAEIGSNATDSSANERAEAIRRQRALLDAKEDSAIMGAGGLKTSNACDTALRQCMAEKCGNDFTKCSKDSTNAWNNKMDACRRNTKCTGHEYSLLAPEILADRDATIELSYYQSVVNCGNQYNDCIFQICGKTLDKCLSKSAGDNAITKCKSIADKCKEQDNGLAGRVMGVFGDLRTIATAEVQKQEKRLYELRDAMRQQCTWLGAMFDERTFDCVYTVNFFAGEDTTHPMSSKKLYAGDSFQCNMNWFGLDVTTFKENAYRLTRSQTAASSAALGAGVGTAVGLWTSGAIGRALDTQKAEKEAKSACEDSAGEWVSAGFNKGSKCDMSNAESNCGAQGGTWDGEKCIRPEKPKGGGNDDSKRQQNNSKSGKGNNPEETASSEASAVCAAFEQDYLCESKPQCKWQKGNSGEKGKCVANDDSKRQQNNSKSGKGNNPEETASSEASAVCAAFEQDYLCESKPQCKWQKGNSGEKGKCVAEESKDFDCGKYKKAADCKLWAARKCWWNGSACVAASEKTTKSEKTEQTKEGSSTNSSTPSCKTICTNHTAGLETGDHSVKISKTESQSCYDKCSDIMKKKCKELGFEDRLDIKGTTSAYTYTCKVKNNESSTKSTETSTNASNNKDKIFMNLTVSDPRGDTNVIEKLGITCDGEYKVHSIGQNVHGGKNTISITVYGKDTNCTITTSEKDCKPYTAKAQLLKSNQRIKLTCPNISSCTTRGYQWINGQCIGKTVNLIWNEVNNKIKVNGKSDGIKNVKCGNQVLSSTNTSITVPKDEECRVTFKNNRFANYTAFNIHDASVDYQFDK